VIDPVTAAYISPFRRISIKKDKVVYVHAIKEYREVHGWLSPFFISTVDGGELPALGPVHLPEGTPISSDGAN
jgi:hypothetical protein